MRARPRPLGYDDLRVGTDSTTAIIVGGGAAGMMTAIAAARGGARGVTVVDGATQLGAKILVSGGARCNVTNAHVTADDFNGGSPALVRRVLRAFDERATVRFFAELGVALHEEEHGKLFPDTNRARTVLAALVAECARLGVSIRPGHRVTRIAREAEGFVVTTTRGDLRAPRVVLATGGRSLPKSGSDGAGYAFAAALDHTIVPTTPALVPLVLEGDFHVALAGVALPVELTIAAAGAKRRRVRGSMLWTHVGISGPAALDLSRHWLRARLDDRPVGVTASFVPGARFETIEDRWLDATARRPRQSIAALVTELVPASMADALFAACGIRRDTPLAELTRDARRALAHALVEWPLPIRDSRGYTHAEVTAGGVRLDEVDVATMASRRSEGLYLVGEILDVDGRLGGFNFQWAWATGFIAGSAIARL